MIEYDPNWPFPQYDENGKQLFPPNWNQRQQKRHDLDDFEDALL